MVVAEGDTDEGRNLFREILGIFNDSQESSTTHKRNVIALKALHLSGLQSKKQTKLSTEAALQWENRFCAELVKLICASINIKKQESSSAAILKFLESFFTHSMQESEKESSHCEIGAHDRMIAYVFRFLLNITDAKDKCVRQRCCILIGAIIESITGLPVDLLYAALTRLSDRLFDREHIVRVQAVIALSRLQDNEIPGYENVTVSSLYCGLLEYDPHPEVRKCVLSAIELTDDTIDRVLERCRDESSVVRKYFFRRKMADIDVKALSIKQRESILNSGLLDRDESVKKACIDMVLKDWLGRADKDLGQFLELLDVVSNTKVAEEFLRGYFQRTSLHLSFAELNFEKCACETALIMKVYCDHVSFTQGVESVREILPEVSRFALYLKNMCEHLFHDTNDSQCEHLEMEFKILQLFSIGQNLDFSDEVGRRFMLGLLRDIISVSNVPSSFIAAVMDFVFALTSDLDERVGIITEMIVELYEDDGSYASSLSFSGNASSIISVHPSLERSDAMKNSQQLKCLEMAHLLLKKTKAIDLQKNPYLSAIFNGLVIESINGELVVAQEIGLLCLGQFCLHFQPLAQEYFALLVEFVRRGHEAIRSLALSIIFDFLMFFGADPFLRQPDPTMEPVAIVKEVLCESSDDKILCVAVEGCCKLLIAGILREDIILEALILLYFHPTTSGKPRLRQCLSFFFPSFCFVQSENQQTIARIIPESVKAVSACYRQSKPGSDAIVKPIEAASQLLFWTNYENLVTKSESDINSHGIVALELLRRCFHEPEFEDVKVLIQCLARLTIDSFCSVKMVKQIDFLATSLVRVLSDKQLGASVRKFIASIIEFDDRTFVLPPEEIDQLRVIVETGHRLISSSELSK